MAVARVTITLATTAVRVTPATREPTVRLKSTTAQVGILHYIIHIHIGTRTYGSSHRESLLSSC